MSNIFAVEIDTAALLFVGQFSHVPQVIRYDVTDAQWAGIMAGTAPPTTTAREVLNLFGGNIPVIFVPASAAATVAEPGAGLQWELTCLATGWWNQDPPTDNLDAFPPGPEAGQSFAPPNFLLADVLLAMDSPNWWVF